MLTLSRSIKKDLIAAGLGSAAMVARRKSKGEKVRVRDILLGAGAGTSVGRLPRAIRAAKAPWTSAEKKFIKGHKGLGSAVADVATSPFRALSRTKKKWKKFDTAVHKYYGAPLAKGNIRLGRGLAEMPGGGLLFRRFGAPVWTETSAGKKQKLRITRATGPLAVAGTVAVPLYAAMRASEDFDKKLAPRVEKHLIAKGIMAPSATNKKGPMTTTKKAAFLKLNKLVSQRKSILTKVAEMQKLGEEYARVKSAEDFLLSLLKDPITSGLVPKTAESFLERRNSLAKMNSEDFAVEKRATLIAAKNGSHSSFMHGVASELPSAGASNDPLGDWLAGTTE